MNGRSCSPFPYATLPRLSRRSVRLRRALRGWLTELRQHTLMTTLTHAFGGGDIRLDLDPSSARLTSELEPDTLPPGWSTRIIAGSSEILLTLDVHIALAVVDHLLEDIARGSDNRPARPLSPLEHGVLAATLATALEQLGQQVHMPLHSTLEPVVAATQVTRLARHGELIVIPLQIALGENTRGHARLILPLDDLTHLDAHRVALQAPTTNPRLARSTLPITLRVELFRQRLGAIQLRRLEPGALWMTHQPATPPLQAWLTSAGERLWQGTVSANGRLTLDTYVWAHSQPHTTTRRRPVSPPTTPPSASSPPLDEALQTLPVEVLLEAGRLTLSLHEVASLAPGDILATEAPLRHPVALTMGGRLIARGELVDVEGRLGVRILDTHFTSELPEPT
ncbi:MAG: FliM/FliN family flagellar motor switch protein [Myxococcota bacterium]